MMQNLNYVVQNHFGVNFVYCILAFRGGSIRLKNAILNELLFVTLIPPGIIFI